MRREQQEGIRGRHLLPPTAEDLARDLLAEIAACYAHVPLLAPVACGHAYLAAVRRAVAAEAQAAELQALVRGLTDRVAAQSELLTRRSEHAMPNPMP